MDRLISTYCTPPVFALPLYQSFGTGLPAAGKLALELLPALRTLVQRIMVQAVSLRRWIGRLGGCQQGGAAEDICTAGRIGMLAAHHQASSLGLKSTLGFQMLQRSPLTA